MNFASSAALHSRATPHEPLLERGPQIAVVDEVLRAGVAGSGRLLVLDGPLGAGKTRLLQHAHAGAADRGMRVLRARCSELERDFPLGVVRQLFEPVVAGTDAAERERAAGGSASPGLEVFEGHSDPALSPPAQDADYVTLHALYRLLVDISARGPVLITADDAQWADAPSLRWLAYVVKRIDAIRASVAVAVCPGERGAADPALDEMRSDPAARTVRLEPLSQSATGELIASRLGVEEVDEEFRRECFTVTDGNPLLVTELLSELAERDIAPRAANAHRVATLEPPDVARIAQRQFAHLSGAARDLATALVVLGTKVRIEDAAELADVSGEAALAAAHELEQLGIARLEDGGLVFCHPIVRVAAHAALDPATAAQLHGRAGHTLHAAGAGASQIAPHLMAGSATGDGWVVDLLLEAAREAARIGQVETAMSYLRRALLELPDEERQVDVMVELGLMEMNVPDTARAGLDRLREARQLAGSPERRAQVAFLIARALTMTADSLGAAEALENAIAELGDDHHELALLLDAELVYAGLPNLATNASAHRRLEAAVAKVGPDSPAAPLLHALGAGVAVVMGTRRVGRAEFVELVTLGKSTFDDSDPRPLWIVGQTLTRREHLVQAADIADHMLSTARARRSPFLTAIGSTLRSNVRFRLGAIVGAEADASAAFAIACAGGWGVEGLRYPLAYLIDALIECDELERAGALLAEHGGAGELPELWPCTLLLDSRARLRLAQHRDDEAVVDALDCGRRLGACNVANPGVMQWRATAAHAMVALGADDLALEQARDQLDSAERFDLPIATGIGLRAVGVATPGEEGIEKLRAAVRALALTNAVLEHARALTDLGTALREGGERTAAREPLRRGLDAAVRAGATALADRAHGELVAAGARPRRRVLKGAEALTTSERRVAEMARDGMTNREIAQALFVTQKTVEAHLSHTYSKLGVHSRTGLHTALPGDVDAPAAAGR